ncbi:MAG: hypothetical protein VYA51_07460, partial [Planctomycetota bacterium]|nr:hypothetical protein [Planctomycetota bacterium]
AKIARLEELVGRDPAAFEVYRQGLATALQQTATRVHVAVEEEPDPDDLASIYGGQRNVDALQQAIPKLVEGLLVTMPEEESGAYVRAMAADVARDLEQLGPVTEGAVENIAEYPRLRARADALRRLCLCFRHLPVSDEVDARLLDRFRTDRDLAKQSIGFRAERGFHAAASRLLDHGDFADAPDFAWLGDAAVGDGAVSPAVAAANVVPMLVERRAELRAMLENVDAAAIDASNVASVPLLLGACVLVGAEDAAERISRAGVRIVASMSTRQRVLSTRESANSILNLAARIDPQLRQRLLGYRVQRTMAKGAKALVSLQYELEGERDFGLDVDALEEMLRTEVANSAQEQFGLRSMGLLHFLPVERRAPLVRELYTAAPRSQRLNVLTQGADFLPEPLSEGFVAWYEGVFRREFEQADKRARDRAALGFSSVGSQRLMRLRLEASLSMGGRHREWLRLLHILTELEDDAALGELLESGIPSMVTRDDLAGVVPNRPKGLNKSQVNQTVRQLLEDGLGERAVAVVERKLRERPEHAGLLYMQWQLRTQLPRAVTFVKAALNVPNVSVEVLELGARFLRERGRLVEAVEVLEKLLEADAPRAKSWTAQLKSLHQRLENAAAADALSADVGARPGKPGKPGQPGAAAISRFAGQLVAVLSGSKAPRALGGEPASARVSGLLKQKDPEVARRDLRRLWRGRGSDRQRIVILEPTAEIAIDQKDLAALAGKEFAIHEARRMRRLLENAAELDSSSLLGAVLQVEPNTGDAEVAARAWLTALREGYGGTAEAVQLLATLAKAELSDEVRAAVVDVLLRRRETPDEARLRSVAHELARDGRKDAAADLYRLGVLAAGEGVPAFLRRSQEEKPGDVVMDVRERLGGELGDATAVALLDDRLATDGSAAMMLAALQAWPELLAPAALTERLELMKAQIARLRSGRLGRFAYDRDAVATVGALCKALARAGDVEGALVELERLLCGEAPDPYGRKPNRSSKQVQAAFAEILSGDEAGRAEWLRVVGGRVLAWHASGRLLDAEETLAALGGQLASAELDALAKSCADQLALLAADDAAAEHALAELWRATGADALAYQLEKRMLAERRLAIAELPRVLRAVRDQDGAAASLAMGEQALAYTAASDVLRALVEIAAEAGQDGRAAPWREELKARDQAAAAAEAKAKAKTEAAAGEAARKLSAPKRQGR